MARPDPDHVNAYIKEIVGEGFSAKDFRTWNATVLCATFLAVHEQEAANKSARKRLINLALRETAEVPQQHSGRLPLLLHRPARLRPLRLGPDDPQSRCAGSRQAPIPASSPSASGSSGRWRGC